MLVLITAGAKLMAVAPITIQSANAALTDYACDRRAQLSTE